MNKILLCILVLLISGALSAQTVGIKTNLLYGGLAQAPNLGLEVSLNNKTTLDFSAGYNWFNLQGSVDNNKKLIHWIAQVEYRRWLCEKFSGHFFGVHILGSQYNISQHKLPLLFGKDSGDFRYQGWATGAGVSYGYQYIISPRWSLEANVGLGYAYLKYDKYDCYKCGQKLSSESRNYIGPTKAGISLIYTIK